MFCRHRWEVLSETVTKSRFESSMEAVKTNISELTLPHQLCKADRKHIQVFTCQKCGKLKRFVENI